MGTNSEPAPKRKSLPTPYVEHDDVLVMIEPAALTQVACIDAAIELGMRPVVASRKTAAGVVATTRPLVIVVEQKADLKAAHLTDLAVGVGAQLVMVDNLDVGPALAERIKLAGKAAKTLHNKSNRNT